MSEIPPIHRVTSTKKTTGLSIVPLAIAGLLTTQCKPVQNNQTPIPVESKQSPMESREIDIELLTKLEELSPVLMDEMKNACKKWKTNGFVDHKSVSNFLIPTYKSDTPGFTKLRDLLREKDIYVGVFMEPDNKGSLRIGYHIGNKTEKGPSFEFGISLLLDTLKQVI